MEREAATRRAILESITLIGFGGLNDKRVSETNRVPAKMQARKECCDEKREEDEKGVR